MDTGPSSETRMGTWFLFELGEMSGLLTEFRETSVLLSEWAPGCTPVEEGFFGSRMLAQH